MKFETPEEMLDIIQDGVDLYCPETETYVFLYGELGSICAYGNIDIDEAKKLQKDAEKFDDYWGAFLGCGGNIYDTIEWYKDAIESGYKFDEDEITDHALEFCAETYKNNWIICSDVSFL